MAEESSAERKLREALKREAKKVKPKPALGKIRQRIAARKTKGEDKRKKP